MLLGYSRAQVVIMHPFSLEDISLLRLIDHWIIITLKRTGVLIKYIFIQISIISRHLSIKIVDNILVFFGIKKSLILGI